MNTTTGVIGMIVLVILLIALSIWASRSNFGATVFRTNATELIYQKDPRTDLCFAQGPKLLAAVPCSEKVEKLID